jgi:thiamine biosynthesis lipoprotein ApbE
VCVLGPEKGMALIDKHPGCAALFVVATSEGVKEVKSKNFDQVVKRAG